MFAHKITCEYYVFIVHVYTVYVLYMYIQCMYCICMYGIYALYCTEL